MRSRSTAIYAVLDEEELLGGAAPERDPWSDKSSAPRGHRSAGTGPLDERHLPELVAGAEGAQVPRRPRLIRAAGALFVVAACTAFAVRLLSTSSSVPRAGAVKRAADPPPAVRMIKRERRVQHRRLPRSRSPARTHRPRARPASVDRIASAPAPVAPSLHLPAVPPATPSRPPAHEFGFER